MGEGHTNNTAAVDNKEECGCLCRELNDLLRRWVIRNKECGAAIRNVVGDGVVVHVNSAIRQVKACKWA